MADPINFLDQEPRQEEELRGQEIRPKKRSSFFTCLLIALLFVGGCIAYRAIPNTWGPDDPGAYDPVTLEPKPPEGLLKRLGHFVFHKEKELAGQRDDRINILLLGMGGPGHDGPYLTDTIIIASIKPSTNQISMVSIPRDLGVDIPGYGWRKINHANAFGETKKAGWGGAFATEVVEKTFDIDIQYYARVDFTAFKEIIDEVGGVTIDVERSFTDTEYPAPHELYQTVSFSKGEKTMDGETALIFTRSRHGNNGEGSDFARSARQQKVIMALKNKILSFETFASPVRINNIMQSLDKHVTTNMSFSDIISFLKLAKELHTDQIINLVLDNSAGGHLVNGTSPEGAFLLQPKTGNFDEINTLIKYIFEAGTPTQDSTPTQAEPAYSPAVVEVQNGTWRAGLGARVGQKIEDAGFSVAALGNTQVRPQSSSGVFLLTDKPTDTVEAIAKLLDLPVKETPPPGAFATSSTDILILLGDDYQE